MFLLGGNRQVDKLYVDDVFSSWTYPGTNAAQTIHNGKDLAGKGGSVWFKSRSDAHQHAIINTAMGISQFLSTDAASAAGVTPAGTDITSFNSDGFSLGTANNFSVNYDASLVSWTFRNAPNFYWHDVVTKSAGSNATFNFSMHSAGLGKVRVKRTDVAGSWYTWHRSLTAGKLLIGETTAAEATLGHITVSGTTVTLVDGVIADGTYLVEAWAHDTSADGMIQCGSYVVGTLTATTLGWEPQCLNIFDISNGSNKYLIDASRAFALTDSKYLSANASTAENSSGAPGFFGPTATGFIDNNQVFTTGHTIAYLAIRRPNKPPTTGTQVYNAIARTGTGAAATVTGVGFAPDSVWSQPRSAENGGVVGDRLRGATKNLMHPTTAIEATQATGLVSFDMDGVSLGAEITSPQAWNWSGFNYIMHFFRCAPGVFHRVCTTGTGANKTEAHNLGKAPELWLHKGRSGAATEWVWGSSLLAATEKIVMPSPNGVVTDATAWNSTYPTASVISFGTAAAVNTTSATYITNLWATLAGISKVFSYTGDGTSDSSKIIDCGFAAGARFVMIIRTTASTAQDIFIWDTVRGIVAANDPHLSLNSTAAEVTTDDSIDPSATGFAVNQVAATNINVNGAVYIGLAYA